MWHPPARSVTLSGEGSEKGQWLLSTFPSKRKLSPSTHPDARHFSSSLYATGTFQAVTLVLELRGSESKSMCGFFKRNCLGIQKFLPPTQNYVGFFSQKVWWLIFLALEPWVGGPDIRRGLLAPKIYLLNFFPPYSDLGPAPSAFPSLLLVWMDVVTSVRICQTFIQLYFWWFWWLFYILVVILMCLCEEYSCAYLCYHLDWKSHFITFIYFFTS